MELMTLAISETSKNKFDVVIVDTENLRYFLLKDFKKGQIVSNTNEPFWDIGAVTQVDSFSIEEEILRITGPCKLITPFDREAFKAMLRRLSAKKSKFFDNKKMQFDVIRVHRVTKIWSDLDDVKRDEKGQYLQKVICFKDMFLDDDEVKGDRVAERWTPMDDASLSKKKKHRLEAHVLAEKKDGIFVDEHFIRDANGEYLVIELLNKDFQWVQYWDWLYTTLEDREDKRKTYMKMLNSLKLEKFFVMYRCFFKDGREVRWIAGIHAL